MSAIRKRIRIAIADDHPLIISGFRKLIESSDDLDVVATFQDGETLLAGIETVAPDILLLDIQMPGKTGDELTSILCENYPDIKIIALTNLDTIYFIRTMMKNGAKGYLLKTSRDEEIRDAITTVFSGDTYLPPVIKDKIVYETLQQTKKDDNIIPQLTRREEQILQLLVKNKTSQQIGTELFLSKRTIENYRFSLLLKFGVKNGASLIKKAMEFGFIK